ncbi:hypothetical protein FBY03_1141, partial [Pseudomonas sp. SJZ079]
MPNCFAPAELFLPGLGRAFLWLCPNSVLHGASNRLLDTVSRPNMLLIALKH